MHAKLFRFKVPIENDVHTAFGKMNFRPCLLIRLEEDGGYYGWGEVWCNYPLIGSEHRFRLLQNIILPLCEEYLKAQIADGLLVSPRKLWKSLCEKTHIMMIQSGEIGPFNQCIAALECAFNDLQAKKSGASLAHYLLQSANLSTFTPQQSIAVYASGINPTDTISAIKKAKKTGFKACKIKIGFDSETDINAINSARQEIGAKINLMVDANQALNNKSIEVLLETLETNRVSWIEEAFAHDSDDDCWLDLAKKVDIPLAAGENFSCKNSFFQLPKRRALSVIQPDIGKWGGLSENLSIANHLHKENLSICPHWLSGGVGLLTSLHLKSAMHDTSGYIEVDFNPNPMRENITHHLFDQLTDGRVQLFKGDKTLYGIGDIDQSIAELSEYQEQIFEF